MLLRTRVSLFVILVFIVVCLILVFVALKREELVREQYSAEIISDQSTLWKKINDNLIQRMEGKAWIIAENEAFKEALRNQDHEDIQQLGARISTQLRSQGIADRFDAVYADGALAYSSHIAVFPSSIIVAAAAREAIDGGERTRGIGNDKQRNVATVLGVPLRTLDGELVGMGVFATDIKEAIVEMERVTNSSVQIVNRRGRLLVGSENSLWSGLEDLVNLDETETLQNVETDERVYSVMVLTQSVGLGSLVGRLISLTDVTDIALQRNRVSQITVGAVVVFLILVLIALNYYLSRAFAPLTEGVDVLNALSRGDLEARVESTGGRDEVGRIISAVEVFRASLITVDRIRRSRRRQHNRQERFIRREMTQLADTLDQGERKAVLEELEQLERQVTEELNSKDRATSIMAEGIEQDASPEVERESDSLAMVAVAFQQMSDRVQDQNQRLRESLAAKNAFIALQKELDIAARVQLSFLPEPIPPAKAFEITGVMKPAKEIGGDFYDFFRIDEHHLGMLVADVSGKGVPAALFMAMSRTMLRTTSTHVYEPGRVLTIVNNLLEQNNREQLFVTVFYGVLDERNGRFTYANGGHNPPILCNQKGVHPLPLTGGVLLAMFPELDYEENHVDLLPGDRLVLFTDGVTEATNAMIEEFGDDRLLDIGAGFP